MKKTLQLSGLSGAVIGTVEIKLNSHTHTVKFNHAITHDDHTKTVYEHSIIGRIDGELVHSARVTEHEDILAAADRFEKEMLKLMAAKASAVKKKTNVELLKKLGYE